MPADRRTILTRDFAACTACGVFLYAICAGFRDNYGILLPYVVGRTGIPYERVSFVIALGQLCYGLMQPVAGYLALRASSRAVMVAGSLLMLAGLLPIPVSTAFLPLALSLGVLLPSGTAALSFGLIMGCVMRRLGREQSHYASGMVAAGIGLGICVLAPVLQSMAGARGLDGAVAFLCVPVALLVPVSLLLTRGTSGSRAASRAAEPAAAIFRSALLSAPYRLGAFAFFTCGFHMALIQTHLFSQLTAFGLSPEAGSWALSAYGAGAIAGAVGSGVLGARVPAPRILAALYASRCLWVLALVLAAPAWAIFAAVVLLGMTGVATIAPTSSLVAGLFGPERLGTLFGLAYLLHQTGAAASAWAGGICLELTGSYRAVWCADIALCLCATLACLAIRTGPKAG